MWIKIISRLYLFFFNDTATTEIYTLSLHDALPISRPGAPAAPPGAAAPGGARGPGSAAAGAALRRPAAARGGDRKSTRLNSSHDQISYAVFCLKKKKKPEIFKQLAKRAATLESAHT